MADVRANPMDLSIFHPFLTFGVLDGKQAPFTILLDPEVESWLLATFALAFVLGLIGTKFIFSSSKCSLDVILLQAVASGGEDVEALL